MQRFPGGLRPCGAAAWAAATEAAGLLGLHRAWLRGEEPKRGSELEAH